MTKKIQNSGSVLTWVPKVGNKISNGFGVANSGYAAGRHTGIDIPGGAGGQEIVWAPPVSGKVVKRGFDGDGYGNYVIIRDQLGRDWLLAHMARPGPGVGTILQQGDAIGKVGASGNAHGAHLHIEQTAPGEKWSYNHVVRPKLVFSQGGTSDPTTSPEVDTPLVAQNQSPSGKKGANRQHAGADKHHHDDNPAKSAQSHTKDGKDNKAAHHGSFIASSPNGDNILARFTKVYGSDAKAKLREAIDAFKAAGGTVDEDYQIGQYGYNVRVKVDGKWVTDTDEVKNKLAAHASVSTSVSETMTDPAAAAQWTRAQLYETTAGGTEKGLTRRFAKAYAGGDTTRGNQILANAIAAYNQANPNNKIEVRGTLGQPGAYVQVMHNGVLTSDSDIVSKKLASYVAGADGQTTAYKEQSRAQQAFLTGANGNAVLNRWNLAAGTTGNASLERAITQLEKANPGNDIKVHGNIGESTFWIEVKTDNGWSSNTGVVIRKLEKYASASASTTGTRQNDTGPAGAVAPVSGHSDNNAQSGSAPAVSGTVHDAAQTNANGAGVTIGSAARQSQAVMGAIDTNADGTLSKAETKVYAAADTNNNGVVGVKEAERFTAVADTNQSGNVSKTEAKAFNIVDTNDNGKISKKEVAAYNTIDKNNDGELSRKEAKQALKAQIDNKQDQREHDLAKEYLAKTGGKSGGSQTVSDQAAALVNAQQAKAKKQDDGPGKKKNN